MLDPKTDRFGGLFLFVCKFIFTIAWFFVIIKSKRWFPLRRLNLLLVERRYHMNHTAVSKYIGLFLALAIATGSAFTAKKPIIVMQKIFAVPTETSGAFEEYVHTDGKNSTLIPSGAPMNEPVGSNDLPSQYRTKTTSVRNQGSYNTCWAFSGVGALEAALSKEGRGDNDFSEQHLTWWASKAYNSDGIGWMCPSLSYGGYSKISAGYFASWQGPKLESDFPYLMSGNNSVPENMESGDVPFGVTGIMYVNNDVDAVKHAIYNYGGVATSYNNGSGYADNRSNYYQNTMPASFSGHAITLIGWDDNYPRTKFKAENQPPYDGAWLAKNSWGDQKGDNGYTWISYYDYFILDSSYWGANLAFTSIRTMNEYDRLYQKEKYGATYFTYISDSSTGKKLKNVTFANVYHFDDEHKYLQRVIFETQTAGADYTVYYIPLQNGKPVTDRSRWTHLASGVTPYGGYINVDVSGTIEVSGKAAIAVELDTANVEGGFAQMGVDEWLTNRSNEYVFKPNQRRNQSFVINGDNVYDLVDIYAANNDNIGGTLVIKAVASSDIFGDADDDFSVTASDALYVLRKSVGLVEMNNLQIKNCDVNFDGIITSSDALRILRKSIGLIPEF